MARKTPFSGLMSTLQGRAEANSQAQAYTKRAQAEYAAKQRSNNGAYDINVPVKGRTGSPSEPVDYAARNAGRDKAQAAYYNPANLGLGSNPENPNSPSGNPGPVGGPVGPSLAELAQKAMDEKYAAVEGRINTSSEANQSAFAEAQAKMAEFYGKAAEDRKEPYAKGVQELQGNLANLGMDFTSGDLAKDWDKNQRNLQENADLALANDQTWFEKMKTVNKDVYSQLLVELAQAKMNEQLMAAGGGSGGGGGGRSRRGGGSSSSGDKLTGDIQSDSDIIFENPGLAAAIGGMPDYLGEVARNTYERGGGDVNATSKLLADRAALENAIVRKLSTGSGRSNPIANAVNRAKSSAASRVQRSSQTTRQLQDVFRQFNPIYQPVNTRNKINSTGKTTKPTSYV